jgi:ATP-dependent Lon protease
MTGELALRGRLLALGAIREKLLSAARAGVALVYIPQANARDLVELLHLLRRKLEIVPISAAR